MTEEADAAGAPIAKDAIDPELIRLARKRPKIGVITAAGLVFLCIVFALRLGPDRRFAGNSATPMPVAVPDVLDGKVDADKYVALDADPLVAHALRTSQNQNGLGLRVVPARGTNERLWIVIGGDGWEPPAKGPYVGRLRPLGDLAFAGALRDYAAEHPRPQFAPATAVRAGFAAGKVAAIGGEVAVADGNQVAFDVLDANSAVIVASFNERLPNLDAWKKELTAAGIAFGKTDLPAPTPPPTKGKDGKLEPKAEPATDQARIEVVTPNAVADTIAKLETAKLFAARVEPVTRHYQTTWGALKASPAAGFTVDGATLPDAQLDLVGLYVTRGIPTDAYALVTTEVPGDYWYILPITIAVLAIALIFAWAGVRAVKRDILAPRTA